MYYAINNAIHLSILSGRHLIIDTYGGSFNNDFNKYFTIRNFNNYSTNYDILVKDNTVKPEMYEQYINSYVIWNPNHDIRVRDKKANWHFDDLIKNNEKVVFYVWTGPSDETDKPQYIRVKSNIVEKLKKYEINKEYIGVHYRNTDIRHDFGQHITKITELTNTCKSIYLGTDDYSAYSKFRMALPNNIELIQYTKPYDNDGRAIHHSNPNKDELIMNSFIDIYLLIRGKYFIPSIKSGFSKKILELREKDTFFT